MLVFRDYQHKSLEKYQQSINKELIMALSDIAIRNAKPMVKPYKLSDSGGLFVLIATTGGSSGDIHIDLMVSKKL